MFTQPIINSTHSPPIVLLGRRGRELGVAGQVEEPVVREHLFREGHEARTLEQAQHSVELEGNDDDTDEEA